MPSKPRSRKSRAAASRIRSRFCAACSLLTFILVSSGSIHRLTIYDVCNICNHDVHHITKRYRISEAAMLRVALLLPDGFATFSFAPLAAFEAANMVLSERFYDVHVTSVAGGRVAASFGMEVHTECVADSAFDTLLVGSPPEVTQPSQRLVSFLRGAPTNTRRIASICVGAFILGEAGLLDVRRATTTGTRAEEREAAI